VGDAVTNTAYAGTDGSRQKWGEEHDEPAPGPASTAAAPSGATAAASVTPEPQGRRVLQRYQRWGEEKDDENGSDGRGGRRGLQEQQYPERKPKHNHDDTYGGNDEPKGAPHDGNGSD
jgi:hypothetical protein